MAESTVKQSGSVNLDIRDWLCLSLVSGVGPRMLKQLLDRFGNPTSILNAASSELRQVPGVGPKLSRAISTARDDVDVQSELELCSENDIRILTSPDDDYPRMLREIDDPPPTLFVRGTVTAADALAISIVGSRHATRYGEAQSERFATSLARAGLTIVSGLARGIDGAAHRAALKAGGRTIAVLGGGILRLYPPEHAALADEIAQQGAIISEMPPRFAPTSSSFPQRNRIISGLTLGTIIVEASTRSGALITARHAMEQGREVFAVPGRIDSRSSRGCHALIRDGAKLIESAEDVLEELGPLIESTPQDDGTILRHPAELQLNDTEQTVLQAIDTEPTLIDQIAQQSGIPVHRVLSTISVLEMRRLIVRTSGNQVARV
ncbi:MAG: DNA-processing protein DprA [Pirellulales bacterium]